jgi:hypothetical protein
MVACNDRPRAARVRGIGPHPNYKSMLKVYSIVS